MVRRGRWQSRVLALAGAIVAGACARTPARELPTGPVEDAPPFITTAPGTARDSALAVNQVARFLAVAMADSAARTEILGAAATTGFGLRAFLGGGGASIARQVERANHLPAGALDQALGNLPELAMAIEGSLSDSADLLVTASLEGADSLVALEGRRIGYDNRGWERPVGDGTNDRGMVLRLTPVQAGVNRAVRR